MKKSLLKQKRNSSQKGFSPIAIVLTVITVVAILLVVTMSLPKNPQQPSTNQQTNVSQNDQTLDKVEDQAYVFHYPKGYVKQNKEGNVLNYENPNTKATTPESISLKIEETGKTIQAPTPAFCGMLAKQFRIKESDNLTFDVLESEKGIIGVGCRIIAISKVDGVNDSVVSLNKLMWNPNDQTGKLYKVRALAFEVASKDQSTGLKEAINAFTLK